MKTGWPKKKLGEVCKIVKGKKPSLFEKKETGMLPYLGARFMRGSKDAEYALVADKNSVAVTKKDLIIICDGSKSGDMFSGFDGVLSSTMGKMKFSEKEIEPQYLKKFLELHFDLFNNAKKGAAIPHLDFHIFKNLEISLPPVGEQKRIVEKLEKLLAKIKKAKNLRAEALAAAKNILPSALHQIFSEGKEKGWEEKELGEICEINPKKSEINNKSDELSVSFVPMSAVDEYLQKIVSFDERKLGEVKKGYTYFADGDIVFAKITPCMENGKIAIAKDLKNGIGFGTTEFHVIRAKDKVLPEWIYYILRQPFFRDIAKTKMTGSAGQKRVPVQFLKSYKIPLPPLVEQKKIVARLDALSEKVQNLKKLQQETLDDLNALSASLLHRAFNGEL